MQKHVLSKSTFIRGLKCSKSLYLNKHNRNLKDELSEMQKAIFNQGDMVGQLAQQLFPNGTDCTTKTFYNFEESIKKQFPSSEMLFNNCSLLQFTSMYF